MVTAGFPLFVHTTSHHISHIRHRPSPPRPFPSFSEEAAAPMKQPFLVYCSASWPDQKEDPRMGWGCFPQPLWLPLVTSETVFINYVDSLFLALHHSRSLLLPFFLHSLLLLFTQQGKLFSKQRIAPQTPVKPPPPPPSPPKKSLAHLWRLCFG